MYVISIGLYLDETVVAIAATLKDAEDMVVKLKLSESHGTLAREGHFIYGPMTPGELPNWVI